MGNSDLSELSNASNLALNDKELTENRTNASHSHSPNPAFHRHKHKHGYSVILSMHSLFSNHFCLNLRELFHLYHLSHIYENMHKRHTRALEANRLPDSMFTRMAIRMKYQSESMSLTCFWSILENPEESVFLFI